MDFPRQELASMARSLADQGIYVGTSSWKYEGWIGLIYTEERYLTRGKLSKAKFNKTCLSEYAEVFSTVCLDGAFYQFPTRQMLDGYLSQVPTDFRLAMKVTEDVTVRVFPKIDRNRARAGQVNEHFLDADLFIASFLGPLESYRSQIGPIIFEFGHFHPGDWERGRQFVEALDTFFARLPKRWPYSVEIRNPNFLHPDYFEVLRRHGVAHTFNNWAAMPSIAEQLEIPETFTADFTAARFLLKPGRGYTQAVENFEPYNEIRDPNPEARGAMTEFVTPGVVQGRPQKRFVYVNNRLEGSAPWTLYAVLSGLLKQKDPQMEKKDDAGEAANQLS